MMYEKYIKKPIVLEAVQFTGSNFDEINIFCPILKYIPEYPNVPIIPTRNMGVEVGSYIVKNINGDYYPCSHDFFELEYEEVQ